MCYHVPGNVLFRGLNTASSVLRLCTTTISGLDKFGCVDPDLFLVCLGNPPLPGLGVARVNCVKQISITGEGGNRLGDLALIDAWLSASMKWFGGGLKRFRCGGGGSVVESGCIPIGASISPWVNRVVCLWATLFSLVRAKRPRGWNACLKVCACETLFLDVQRRACAEVGDGQKWMKVNSPGTTDL